MENSNNYYDILGISKTSDNNTIKKSYRKLAMIWHPDKQLNKNDKEKKIAETKFKKISEAYETLIDPEKRRRYDMINNNDFNFQHKMFGSFFNTGFDDFDLFNSNSNIRVNVGSNKRHKPILKKGITKHMDIDILLEHLYRGYKYSHQIIRMINGSPIIDNIILDIQPGWKEGTKLTFTNKGDVNFGYKVGDLIVTIKECKHNYYTRKGNDLEIIKTISLEEAINGISCDVKCIDGSNYKVILEDGISETNFRYKVTGKGMPIRKNGKKVGYGDMIVGFNVLIK